MRALGKRIAERELLPPPTSRTFRKSPAGKMDAIARIFSR
jgi:hypothetical protein